MKKLLAIILAVAMLCSMFAVGALAATQSVTQDAATQNSYWNFQAGNSWHPVKFNNPSSTVEMDVRLDDASANLGCYGLSNAPAIGASYVGLKDNNISVAYTFEVGTWYHLKFVSASGSTTIYVDGAEVGTVAAEITYYEGNQFYWAPVLVSMDNVSVGGQLFDFEGDNSAWNTESGQGQLLLEDIPGAIHNNLTWSWPEQSSKYLSYDAENAYIYTQSLPVGPDSGYTTFNFKVRFKDATSETRSYFGTDIIISPSKIGFGSNTVAISPALSLNEWHEVSINCYNMNGASFYKIDGGECSISNNDGIINGVMKSSWCGGGILLDFDDFVIKSSADGATYETIYTEDFEDGRWDISEGNGIITYDNIEMTESQDIGKYFWNFQAGNSWHPVKFNNPANTVEMNIRLDDATSNLGCYGLSNAPAVGASYVGLKDNTISVPYTFAVGTWYHLKFVSANGSTTIYVDGAEVGTVAAEITYYDGNQFYWAPVLVSMDNVSVGGQTFDFEGDNSAWNTESGQGQLLQYDLTIGEDSIFNHFETYNVGGQAWAILAAPTDNNVYTDISGINPGGKDYILNFDLALIPNTNERVTPTFDDKDTFIELWTDTAGTRFKVGTKYVGCNKDLRAFEWGDATPTNFHNVTYVVKGTYGKMMIYLDKELVYEGTSGKIWEDRFIGMVWNGSAILDNIQLMDLNYQQKSVNPSDNGMSDGKLATIDLDAECSGRVTFIEGGHIHGTTTTTTTETCVVEGVDTTVCAVCGAVSNVAAIDMIPHNWQEYNEGYNSVAPTETTDGVRVLSCKYGCGTTTKTSLPAYNKYEGELWVYTDFEEADLLTGVLECFNDEKQYVENGYGVFAEGCSNNYNILSSAAANCPWNYSASIDFKNVTTFDTSDTAQYGHVMYFWFGGDSGTYAQAGYDFDNGYFFIRPSEGSPFDEVRSKKLYQDDNKWHTLTLRYNVTDDVTAYIALELDGEVVVAIDDSFDAYGIGATTLENNKPYVIFRDFGVAAKVDNIAVGSSDFKWAPKPVAGDANGDGRVTSADLLYIKYFLAGEYDASDVVLSNVDLDGDGEVTALDYTAVKNIVLGVTVPTVE